VIISYYWQNQFSPSYNRNDSAFQKDASLFIQEFFKFKITIGVVVGRVARSVWQLATGWTVRRSNPGGGEISRTCPDRPWGPHSLLYNGYRVFRGG